jgi:hypothetical protein
MPVAGVLGVRGTRDCRVRQSHRLLRHVEVGGYLGDRQVTPTGAVTTSRLNPGGNFLSHTDIPPETPGPREGCQPNRQQTLVSD